MPSQSISPSSQQDAGGETGSITNTPIPVQEKKLGVEKQNELSECDIEKQDKSDSDSNRDDEADIQQVHTVASTTHSLADQMNILSSRQLLIAFPALSVALFVSFIDQTSVSTAIPAISAELNVGASISWVGASFLIASTAFQLINGRLSDIFGRKFCLLICMGILAIGDLLCGFSQSATMLFACRAIAGIGAGGVNSLAMIIVSDITTFENRGKFQGILGAVIAMANGMGPFLGGALVEKSSWRWIFWLIPPITIPAMLVIWFYLPLKHVKGDYGQKIKKIDFVGVGLNIASVLLILIPISGGGSTYEWNSPIVISMITIGGVLAILFGLWEWKLASIPIMPLHIVKYPSCDILYFQNFFTGLVFFSNFFYLSIYFQSVRGHSPLISGTLLLPLILCTAGASVTSGQIMTRYHSYYYLCVVGFSLWTVGTGLKCLFRIDSPIWIIIVSGIIEGAGIGCTLQPTLVAILANSKNEERAVATGLRNFLRTIGGAFGLCISGAILNNVLSAKLSGLPFMTPEILKSLASSTYGLAKQNLKETEKTIILNAFMDALRYIFIMYVCAVGINVVTSLFVRHTSLKIEKKDGVREEEQDSVEEDGSI